MSREINSSRNRKRSGQLNVRIESSPCGSTNIRVCPQTVFSVMQDLRILPRTRYGGIQEALREVDSGFRRNDDADCDGYM